MDRSVKEKLINNLGLKVIALLFAVVLWLLVVNINDPVESRTFSNIKVSVLHEEIIENQAKTWQVLDDSDNVTVVVKGKRSVLERIRSEDISASADIKELMLENMVPIEVTVKGFEGEYREAYASPKNMQIKIENSKKAEFPITVVTTGEVQKGYALGSTSAQPQMISVTGPQSLVGRIEKAVARVDVSGLAEDTTLDATLILYDSAGNEINQELLSNTVGVEGVKVNITVLKTEIVPLKFDDSEIRVSKGHVYTKLECEPESVEVVGEESAIRELSEINIPAEALDVGEISEKTEVPLDITPYLPNNIKLVDESANIVVVTILVDKVDAKIINLPVESIVRDNAPEGFKVEYGDTKEIALAFTSEDQSKLDGLTVDDLKDKVRVDLRNITEEGTYTLKLQVTPPEGCELEEEVQITLILTKK